MRMLFVGMFILLLLPILLTTRVGASLVGGEPPPWPSWSLQGYTSGTWQEGVSNYLSENFGLRNEFVRLNNWKNYGLFGEISARDVIEGKNGYLYEEPYVQTAVGGNERSSEHFAIMGEEMAVIRDSLAAHGTEFLIVMAPGKGSYYPEYFPEPYASMPLNPANETSLLRILRQRQISYINFNQWFREMKDTVSYPLFPQRGIHWTQYGSIVATDSLINYVERTLDIDMPELVIDSVEISEEQRGIEGDLWRGMNLPVEPRGFPIGYPHWHRENAEKTQPRVLFIGDSFYWSLYQDLEISGLFFGDGDFWYYFSQIMRTRAEAGRVVDEVTLPADLYGYDMVVLFETDSHYHRIGNGFLGTTFAALESHSADSISQAQLNAKMAEIRADEKWYTYVQEKAESAGKKVQVVLQEDAEYVLREQRKADRARRATEG